MSHPIVQQWVHGEPPPETKPDPYAPTPETEAQPVKMRRVELTKASEIAPKRVRWIWKDRLAMGTLGLLAGREGLGKSTLAYQLAADITQGALPGEHYGHPKAVIVCASEDSWEHTIVPRLIAAGADRDLVYRAEIVLHTELRVNISLPRDFAEVEAAALEVEAGLMILDPLMSVIDSRLDTHRDREVRTALEPLKTLAERSRMSILGLIHHNKSGSTDALQLVMGSKAFSAVARSVHTCIPDPDDDTQERRLFATSKNNLGRLDLPVLGFTITGHAVDTIDDGVAWTGRINWTGEVAGAMHEIMTRAADPERTATSEAAEWLQGYLEHYGGECAKTDIEKAGRVAGHTPTALRRARERLRLEHRNAGFPRQTFWSLPGAITTDEEAQVDVTEPRRSADTTEPGDTTAEPLHSRVNGHPTLPTDTVASKGDATVTPLGLTRANTETGLTRVHARAGGDTSTDTTGLETPLETPSRASRASRVTAPPRTRARPSTTSAARRRPRHPSTPLRRLRLPDRHHRPPPHLRGTMTSPTPTDFAQHPDTTDLARLTHVHVAGRCIKNRTGPICTTTADGVRRCRVCGCTDGNACQSFLTGPCWWIEEDLCSACRPGSKPLESGRG